ncbi:MAG: hypothetical protein ACKVS5_09670 [Parvularculaceae bacterium]
MGHISLGALAVAGMETSMHASLRTIGVAVASVTASIFFAACSKASDVSTAPRLDVDSQYWPVDVDKLALATTQMISSDDEPAYLVKIYINLPPVNPPIITSVYYDYYLPKTGKRIRVGYAKTDASLPPDQMEAARRAGVADIFKAAEEAAAAPEIIDLPLSEDARALTPLLVKPMALKEAHQLAQRAGLQRAETIVLETNIKDPTKPVMMWTFRGPHTLADSKAIHIDALDGRLIDEDEINMKTRAERDADYAEYLAALRSLVRPLSSGASGGSEFCTGGYVWDSGMGYCRARASFDPDLMPTQGAKLNGMSLHRCGTPVDSQKSRPENFSAAKW